MGWAEDLRAREEEQLRRQRLHASAGAGYDPETARRVFTAAAKTELPTGVVAADLDGIEKSLEAKSFDYEQYTDEVNGSPVFNRFAAEDPYNYAVLERSRRNLTRFERTLEPIFQGWDSGWGMIEMAEIRDRRIKGDKRDGDDERLKDLRMLTSGAGDYFGVDSWYMKSLVMSAQQGTILSWIVKESADEIMLGGMAGAGVGAAYGSATLNPLGTGAGMVGGFFTGMGAGFLAGRTEAAFRLERGLAYDEYLELGLNENDSLRMANAVGTVNAAAESIGLGALTKRLPGFRKIQGDYVDRTIDTLFDVPVFKQGVARATLQYGEGMATELVTEIVQESTLMAGREYLKSQARDAGDMRPEMRPMTSEEFFESIKHIAAATMYGTMLIGAAGPMVQLRSDSHKANQAKAQQQYLATLGETVQDEKLREDAPDAWRALLDRLGADGPVKEFRVDRKGWRSYWQGNEIDPDVAAKELGLDDEQLNGDPQDVVIPFKTFVDKIGATEHFNALLPDIRVDPDAMTQRDAETWVADKENMIDRVEKQLKEQYNTEINPEIAEDVKKDLIARGDVPKAADIQARLYAAVFTNYARKAGMDPMELHRLRLKGIERDVPASMQQGTTDMQFDPQIDALRAGDFPQNRDIFGDSLIDMIKSSGKIQDQGGELAGRDFGSHFPGVMSAAGMTHDAAAELAFERGYIPEYDVGQFMEALDREIAGEAVYSRTAGMNEELNEKRLLMEQAAQFLDAEGIDLSEMTNDEVREAINGIKTFEQSDLEAYTRLLGIAMDNDPDLLLQVWRKMPRIRDEQDFSSITFTDKFETTSGKTGTVEINAQEAFDEAVNERNVLKQLLDCVNG